jgi:hypothetical protein
VTARAALVVIALSGGCGEPRSEAPAEVEPVATPTPPEPRAAEPEATAFVLDGDAPTPPVALSPGFTPDPVVRRLATRGGTIGAEAEGCDGFGAATPDVTLDVRRPIAELRVLLGATEDDAPPLGLMHRAPRSAPSCGGASLTAPFQAGLHRFWVLTPDADQRIPYALGFTELEETVLDVRGRDASP